jgi:hypothetical protein
MSKMAEGFSRHVILLCIIQRKGAMRQFPHGMNPVAPLPRSLWSTTRRGGSQGSLGSREGTGGFVAALGSRRFLARLAASNRLLEGYLRP